MISRQCFLFAKRALWDINIFKNKNLFVVLPSVEEEKQHISSSQTV